MAREISKSAIWPRALRWAAWGLPALAAAPLALLVAAHLWFFATRAAHLLGYPYPLDYGEGPLQAQLAALLAGAPIWQLYGDPAAPPFLVVNYPPTMHALAYLPALAALGPLGDPAHAALLGGRLVSLAAGLLCVPAIWLLAGGWGGGRPAALLRLLVALALLGIPIAREWSSVLRVDMAGVCLGLWGLVAALRWPGRRGLALAALLLALSVLAKPSLLAAPAAAFCFLLFRSWRRALALALLTALVGGGLALALQLASGGWFWLHAVQANANAWDHDLARSFWRDQLVILRPLLLAGALAAAARIALARWGGLPPDDGERLAWVPALLYSCFGLLAAVGVGKLGAYTNYFLEAYAGLIWLVATGAAFWRAPGGGWRITATRALAPALCAGLCALSLTRYYPLWSEEYLLPAGIIEGRNPARVSIGGYGVAQDLEREGRVLAARGRINAALGPLVRAAGAPILTDVPGVAAQAGALSRLQMFEHRMLLDAGLYDQRPLLRDLAGGRVPLVVLDYLGNWMTPEQITLLTRRYAQDVSVGTYSVYRPVELAVEVDAERQLPGGLRLAGAALTRPADGDAYGPGETLVVALRMRALGAPGGPTPEVALQLADGEGRALLGVARPLLYGALAPADWGDATVEHLQPLALPPELPPGTYQLRVGLRAGEVELAPPEPLATIRVAETGGRLVGEQGLYVPAALLQEWALLGGYEGPGDPVTPAVPIAGGLQQCFKTACLRLSGGQVARLPVGELAWMADAGLPRIPGSPPEGQLSDALRPIYEQLGGEAALGPPLGGEMKRFDMIVQYTRYARLERPLAGGPARLGSVGEDVLRLPGGAPYRWP